MENLEPADRAIWSADVSGGVLLDKLREMPDLRVIKLDRLFLTGRDLQIIRNLQAAGGFKVFVDAKIIEIPSKVEAIANKYLAYRPWMLNCMAGAISNGIMEVTERGQELDGLKRFADACHAVGTLPCAVTVLTSKTQFIATYEFGHQAVLDQVLWYCQQLMLAGFTDVVCSPQEAKVVSEHYPTLNINCPGVRPEGSAAGDQARVDTVTGALTAGATRLVIGRPITEGDSPANLKAILDEIRGWEASRV